MNKNHEENFTDRPGLRCRLVRRWEAWRGPASGHTALAERHMETCEECQAFFAEDFGFEDMLRSAARAEKATAIPQVGFEQRILRAVRESQPKDGRERVTTGRKGGAALLAWSLTGAAAGVALALVVVQRMQPERTGPEIATTKPSAVEGQGGAGDVTDDVEETPLHWWRSLDARGSALELAAKNPLQQEIDSISTDAQSVIGFLALNFLPSAGNERVLEQPQGSPSQG